MAKSFFRSLSQSLSIVSLVGGLIAALIGFSESHDTMWASSSLASGVSWLLFGVALLVLGVGLAVLSKD